MKKRVKSIFSWITRHRNLSIGILVVILILGFFLRPKPPKPPETTPVTRGDLSQTLSVSGSVNSLHSVDLSFLTAGKMVYLATQKGDHVTAGETIASQDTQTVEKNLQQALLDYSIQRDAFDQTIANNGGTQNPNDAVNDTMKRVLEDNQYNLDKAVNSVELQSIAEQDSFISSPIDGYIIREDEATAGVNVTPATIFTVADLDDLVFDMDVDESDVGNVHTGQEVDVILDAFPNTTLKLPVKKIDYASHTTSTNETAYTVEVNLPSDHNYRIGMSGNADIILAEHKNVLIIPTTSLIDQSHVYVKSGTTFKKQEVRLGLQNDTQAEVVSGLSEGDQVAVDPAQVGK